MKRISLFFLPATLILCLTAACNTSANKATKTENSTSMTDNSKQAKTQGSSVNKMPDSVATDKTTAPSNAGTEESKIREVGTKFLEVLFAEKFNDARKYSTKESEEFINMMEETAKSGGKSPNSKPPTIIGIKIDGNNAVIQTSTPPGMPIPVKKINGEWKVNMPKEQ